MILNKYTIYDSALEAYHQDYSLENDAIALDLKSSTIVALLCGGLRKAL